MKALIMDALEVVHEYTLRIAHKLPTLALHTLSYQPDLTQLPTRPYCNGLCPEANLSKVCLHQFCHHNSLFPPGSVCNKIGGGRSRPERGSRDLRRRHASRAGPSCTRELLHQCTSSCS